MKSHSSQIPESGLANKPQSENGEAASSGSSQKSAFDFSSQTQVRCSIEGPNAIITLNCPERHNSLITELMEAFLHALHQVRLAAGDITSLVLRAEGANFSIGGDVQKFYDMGTGRVDYALRLLAMLNRTIIEMIELPIPIITRVQGMVTGGSFGFILASDLVAVSETTFFSPYYTDVGFAPDGGWSGLLPHRIGEQRAREVLLLNRKISAREALEWGLVNAVLPEGALDRQVSTWQRQLLDKVPGTLAGVKLSLKSRQAMRDIEASLEHERQVFVGQIATEHAERGMRAFLGISE